MISICAECSKRNTTNMALNVLHGITSDIAENKYYSIIADESCNASNTEQLVICICWVDKEISVCEEYIGLLPVAQTNADTIVIFIKDVQLRMNLRIHDACGQCMKDV